MHPKRSGMLVRSILDRIGLVLHRTFSSRFGVKNGDFKGVRNAAAGAASLDGVLQREELHKPVIFKRAMPRGALGARAAMRQVAQKSLRSDLCGVLPRRGS